MANLSDFISGSDPQYWVSGTTYALGKTVRSPSDHQRYVRVVAGAGTTDPANDATNWRPDGGRPIKSIQRGVATVNSTGGTGNITISAVNTAKTEVRFLGAKPIYGPGDSNYNAGAVELLNSTTIRLLANVSSNSTPISWELTEYY